jgi:hypothetical protein
MNIIHGARMQHRTCLPVFLQLPASDSKYDRTLTRSSWGLTLPLPIPPIPPDPASGVSYPRYGSLCEREAGGAVRLGSAPASGRGDG